MTLVINLFSGPGTGKSTTASGLFFALKNMGYKCEMALEYAKELAWENQLSKLTDQLYIFAKQHRRINRLMFHDLDFIISDSPLWLSIIYGSEESPAFKDLVLEKAANFNNFNIFLERVKPYMAYGRYQTEEAARGLDKRIREELPTIEHTIIADELAPLKILDLLVLQGRLNETGPNTQ